MRIVKYIFGGTLALALIMALFLAGIRSCLSKYDQHSAILPVLYFGSADSMFVLSLVKFSETTSYSQGRGFTSKTVTNSYYLQANSAMTGSLKGSKRISDGDAIKNYPEALLGAAGTHAWLFLNGLLAYDAYTFKKIADIKLLEQINPSIKGKMPVEAQYYHFNEDDKSIGFTLNDGSAWKLNTTDLKAYPDETPELLATEDKLAAAWSRAKKLQHGRNYFNQESINQDSSNGQWCGIYTRDEIAGTKASFPAEKAWGKDERRQFVTGKFFHQNNRAVVDTTATKFLQPGLFFLDGGFLLDKETGSVIQLSNPQSYLVVYKSQIGTEGEIMLTRLLPNGQVSWKVNTGLKDWLDWKLLKNRIVVFGNNRKELTSANCSILISIGLDTGDVICFDYFTNKTGTSLQPAN